MKRDIHNTEQVYECMGWDKTDSRPAIPCGVYHQESTVAVREAIVDRRVERTMYCDQCGSEALKLCTEDDAVDHGRRVKENDEQIVARVTDWVKEQTA